MDDNHHLQADLARIAKLKDLATSGKIDRPFSYFNHLIVMYGEPGRLGLHRALTDRERRRIDLFLESFAPSKAELSRLTESGD